MNVGKKLESLSSSTVMATIATGQTTSSARVSRRARSRSSAFTSGSGSDIDRSVRNRFFKFLLRWRRHGAPACDMIREVFAVRRCHPMWPISTMRLFQICIPSLCVHAHAIWVPRLTHLRLELPGARLRLRRADPTIDQDPAATAQRRGTGDGISSEHTFSRPLSRPRSDLARPRFLRTRATERM